MVNIIQDSNTGKFLVQYMKITKVLKQKPIELSQNNVENQKIIEDYLKDKKFRNIVISGTVLQFYL